MFAPLIQAGTPDPWVVPGQAPLAESSLYSRASQYRSRHPVEAGAEARGIEASPRGGEADLESFWPGTGESVCDSSDIALSPLVLSDSSSSTGVDAMVQTWLRLCLYAFPPIALLLVWGPSIAKTPFWPGQV